MKLESDTKLFTLCQLNELNESIKFIVDSLCVNGIRIIACMSMNLTRVRLILTCIKSRMFQGKLSVALMKRGAINYYSRNGTPWNEVDN